MSLFVGIITAKCFEAPVERRRLHSNRGGKNGNIGNLVVPVSIALIIIFGFCRKVPLFEAFTDGAKEGIVSMFSIAPSLIGLITAVSMLRASGFLKY